MTAGVQDRPAARKLSNGDRQLSRELYAGMAGNAVVVQRLLAERGVVVTAARPATFRRGPSRARQGRAERMGFTTTATDHSAIPPQ